MSQKDITRRDFVRKAVATTTVGSVGATSLLSAKPAQDNIVDEALHHRLSRQEREQGKREELHQMLQETVFDPESLEDVIDVLGCMSDTVRYQGILALDPFLDSISDPILRTLAQYTIDGVALEAVMHIAADMVRARMFQYESYCHIVTWGTKMLVECRGMIDTQNRLLPILGLDVKVPREDSDLEAILERNWARKDTDAFLETFLETVRRSLQDTDFSPCQPRAAIEAIACLSETARIYGLSSLNREALFNAIGDPTLRAVLQTVAAGTSEADVCAMASALTQAELKKQELYLTVITHGCKLVMEAKPGDEVRQRLHAVVSYLS